MLVINLLLGVCKRHIVQIYIIFTRIAKNLLIYFYAYPETLSPPFKIPLPERSHQFFPIHPQFLLQTVIHRLAVCPDGCAKVGKRHFFYKVDFFLIQQFLQPEILYIKRFHNPIPFDSVTNLANFQENAKQSAKKQRGQTVKIYVF